jgi:NAD(P)-dependent dehydrogenase (short-subunit alcohol dehydrogenase family)
MLMLDVCSDDSVKACVQMVMKQAGRVDVLVNNAGHNLIGGIEETSMEEVKSQFETNFFGVVRMTKAVLPIMRHQRDGHIINISSLGGLIPLVFGAFYSASKFALEAYTECLRHELKSFNVRVSLLEPGTIKTGSLTYIQEPRQPLEAYDAMRKRAFQVIRHSLEKGDHPARVAGFVSHILQSRAPKLRYPTGQEVAWLPRIKNLVPDVLWERGTRKMFKLD